MDNFFDMIIEAFKAFSARDQALSIQQVYAVKQQPGNVQRLEKVLSRLVTSAELIEKERPKTSFVVEGLVPVGLTNLAGRPKSGKTVFAMQLAHACSIGGELLGQFHAGRRFKVLYLSLEQDEIDMSELQEHMKLYKKTKKSINYAFDWPYLSDGGLEDLELLLEASPETKVIIIDTLAHFAGEDLSRNYGREYRTLNRLRKLAKAHSAAIIVCHHTTKNAKGSSISDLYGSTGIAAAADSIILLARKEGQDRAVLTGVGNKYREFKLDIEFTGELWTLTNPANSLPPERSRIFDELVRSEEALSLPELATRLGKSKPGLINHLNALISLGLVKRLGKGLYKTEQPSAMEGPKYGETGEQGEQGDLAGNMPKTLKNELKLQGESSRHGDEHRDAGKSGKIVDFFEAKLRKELEDS